MGEKLAWNVIAFARHSRYRVRCRRTFGEGLALDPFRNSDTSSKILPNGQRIHRPGAVTVIKFDPAKLHTAMPLEELEIFRLEAAAKDRHASIRAAKGVMVKGGCNKS